MLTAPEPLANYHYFAGFDSGVASLDDWLKRRAVPNQGSGASRTLVACDGGSVVACYARASSAVTSHTAPGGYRRNMPDPIPVVVLGRLAIARSHQRRGLGRALFQDAGRRVVAASGAIGIQGLFVHALSDQARDFYLRLGLKPSPLDPMTLMVTLRAALVER